MTAPQPDVAGAVLALDQAMIALAVAKSTLLGETSSPMLIPTSGPDPYSSGQCDADWGSATPSQRCVLVSDHPAPHRDRAGHQWPAMTMGEMRAELARSTKHGHYDAASAAEVAEGVEQNVSPLSKPWRLDLHICGARFETPPPPNCPDGNAHHGTYVVDLGAPSGHLPQHTGGHPECTAPGCGQPGHHLHAATIPADGA